MFTTAVLTIQFKMEMNLKSENQFISPYSSTAQLNIKSEMALATDKHQTENSPVWLLYISLVSS